VVETDSSPFIFVTCQRGAEKACKAELERSHPELRLAYSRSGFVTFKVVGKLPHNFVLHSTFVRSAGWSLGKLQGTDATSMAREVIDRLRGLKLARLHIWQRDEAVPGHHGFEPFPSELAKSIASEIENALSDSVTESGREKWICDVNQVASANERVGDVVVVEPGEWWVGWHVASSVGARWVGGVPPLEPNAEAINRAYYKVAEAIQWSQLPLRKNDLCIDLGSSPGGATQYLVERGAKVFAVDPAEMDEEITAHPNVMHVQMRSKDLPKKDVAGARWLFADLNVAPNYTLDTVEEIVTNQHVSLRGLILTLKLSKWELADHLGEYRDRVKAWGFDVVKTRQLAFNRREVCLAAIRDKMDIRAGRKKPIRKKNSKRTKRKQP
jgi:23S rRNA (cytidine2498-2'-O)-methyltransferase